MATWEYWTSGATVSDGVNSRHQRIVFVDSAGDSGQAIAAALAFLPPAVTTQEGFLLDHRVSSPVPMDDRTLWKVVIDYQHKDARPNQNQNPGESRLSLDVSGTEILITEALEQENFGPDFKKAINVNNGRAEGTNIIVPKATFNERHTFAASFVTQARVNAWIDTVGTTNQDTFRGRVAEELLLLGVAGQQRGTGAWDVDFSFWLEKERVMKDANDQDRTKKGHRFAWWSYVDAEDDVQKRLIPTPEGLHISKIYEDIPFAATLGI